MSLAGLPLDRLDVLFLDLGNTLVGMDFDLIAERLAARGIRAEPADIARAEAAARPALSRHLGAGASSETRDSFAFHVRRTLEELGPNCGRDDRELDAMAGELAAELKTHYGTRRLWSRLLPGVPDALARLRSAGLRLVVVSNSDGTARPGAEALGLTAYLEDVVDSSVVGFEKPDPRIFAHALELVDGDPTRTAHVGDLFAIDVVGARAAGLHAVLLDPYDDWRDAECARAADLPALARAILAARR